MHDGPPIPVMFKRSVGFSVRCKHMRIKLIAIIGSTLASLVLFGSSAFAQGIYISGTVGNDISWPNCTSKVSTSTKFGIVGVTAGLGYSTNPCLTKEASHFSNPSL